MGGYESDADGRDDRSVSRSRHSIREDGNRSVTHSNTERRPHTRAPPISFHTRYPGSNGGSSSHGRSQSHSRNGGGSVRESDASGSTLRPPSHRSESRHRNNTASQASGSTLGSLQSRSRGDVTSQGGGSYASDGRSHASKQHSKTGKRYKPAPNRGSLYEEEWLNGKNVYLVSDDDEPRKPRESVPRSEASGHTIKYGMEELSSQAEGLQLNSRNNRLTELESVAAGEDHATQTSASHHGSTTSFDQQSYHSGSQHGRPESNADSYNRSHASKSSYNAPSGSYAPSVARSRTRNPPPPHGSGTYVERVDYRESHVTNIHAPDMSFMDGESKKQRKARYEHEQNMAMISKGLRPRAKKTIWDD